MHGRLRGQRTSMKGWSPFKLVVGALFLELGVQGGVEGKLFDLSVTQVEGLLEGNQTDTGEIDTDEPLMTMACAAVWVLDTRAQYTPLHPWHHLYFLAPSPAALHPVHPRRCLRLWRTTQRTATHGSCS